MSKTSFVTGGAKRLGKIITETLITKSDHIIVHYNQSEPDAIQFQNKSKQNKCNVHLLKYDFNESFEIQDFIDQLYTFTDQIDIVFLNASQYYQTPVNQCTQTDWDTLMRINSKIPFFIAKEIALRNKNLCRIIFISDQYGRHPQKHFPIYSLTKSLINSIVNVLSKELEGKAIVGAIAPGGILNANFTKPSPLAKEIQPSLDRITDFQKAVQYFIDAPDPINGEILKV